MRKEYWTTEGGLQRWMFAALAVFAAWNATHSQGVPFLVSAIVAPLAALSAVIFWWRRG